MRATVTNIRAVRATGTILGIRPGSVLKTSLTDEHGRLLLVRGSILTEAILNRLHDRKLNGRSCSAIEVVA